jgi:hypothetical protein
MSKITLAPIQGGYNLSAIQSNFDAIAQELNTRVLYRINPVGEPNSFQTDFDANEKRIFNLPTPLSASEPVRLMDLQAAIGGSVTYSWNDITGKPTTFPPSAHTHPITDIDGLVTALTGKQDTLVSGTSIKTVNGNSLLGSGDIVISGGGGGGGDVVGPASATNNAVAIFSGTTGKLLADSAKTLPTGTVVGTSDTQTLTSKTLTSPTINGGTHTALTSLGVRNAGTGAFDMTIAYNGTLTAGRALTWNLNDAARTVSLAGNITTANAFTTAGNFALTLTQTAATNVTLPTTGTLATLAGTETLSNKTLASPSATGTSTFQGIRETVITANTGTAYTVVNTAGSILNLTLTGNCVFTFPAASSGGQFTLLLLQDATGARTITWPTSVRWPGGTAPTITATASRTDVISFVSDGTYWLGFVGGQNFNRA